MRPYADEEVAAYGARNIIPRNLVYVWAKDRITGDPVEFGFSNVTGSVALQVIDALTNEIVTRNFTSRGALLSVGDIPQSDDLSVRSVDVTLSQLNADVENALRGYDMRQAPIQIYRALFSKDNPRALVFPARARFVGFVNGAPMSKPPIGGQASSTLNCVGCTRELTRVSTEVRSDESQQRRHPGDRFFKWVPATGSVQVAWGQANDASNAAAKQAANGFDLRNR